MYLMPPHTSCATACYMVHLFYRQLSSRCRRLSSSTASSLPQRNRCYLPCLLSPLIPPLPCRPRFAQPHPRYDPCRRRHSSRISNSGRIGNCSASCSLTTFAFRQKRQLAPPARSERTPRRPRFRQKRQLPLRHAGLLRASSGLAATFMPRSLSSRAEFRQKRQPQSRSTALPPNPQFPASSATLTWTSAQDFAPGTWIPAKTATASGSPSPMGKRVRGIGHIPAKSATATRGQRCAI